MRVTNKIYHTIADEIIEGLNGGYSWSGEVTTYDGWMFTGSIYFTYDMSVGELGRSRYIKTAECKEYSFIALDKNDNIIKTDFDIENLLCNLKNIDV